MIHRYLSLRKLVLFVLLLCGGLGLNSCFFTKPKLDTMPLYTEKGKNKFALTIEDEEGRNLLEDEAFVRKLSVSWQYYSTAWVSDKVSKDKQRYEIGASIPSVKRDAVAKKGERFVTNQKFGLFKGKQQLEFITNYIYEGKDQEPYQQEVLRLLSVEVAGQVYEVPSEGGMPIIPLVYRDGVFRIKGA